MRVIYICLFSLLISYAGYAQPRAKKIETLKLAYLIERLDLNDTEEQDFRTVYNNYQKELNDLMRQKRLSRLEQRSKGPDQALDDELTYETRILDLKKHYRKEFSQIMSKQKAATLFLAEREFREKLIKELQNRRDKY